MHVRRSAVIRRGVAVIAASVLALSAAAHAEAQTQWSPVPDGHPLTAAEMEGFDRHTRHGEYTNVVSNGDREGKWIGRDTIEYVHAGVGRGASPRRDMAPGVGPEQVGVGVRFVDEPGNADLARVREVANRLTSSR